MSSLFKKITPPIAPHNETIQRELVEMFDRRAPWPLIGLNIVLATILMLIWWTPNTGQWVWYIGISLVSLANMLRHAHYHEVHKDEHFDALYWYRSFTYGTIAVGIAWGMGGILFYATEMPLQSAVILLLICGIAAGVAASQSSIWPSVVGFVCCATLPAAGYLLTLGGSISIIVSLLLLFYLGYILVVGRINHNTLLDSVRLRLEKQQLLEELASSERQFRAMVENIPDLFTVVSHDGMVIFESPSSSKLLGYQPDTMLGTEALSYIHPDEIQQAQQAIQETLYGPQGSATAELRIRNINNEWRLFECVGRRLNELDPPAIVINARDITDRHTMEDELRLARDKAEQASLIKSHFLATVSHEIRTPMHAILGMAEMLQQTHLNEKQQEYVETFHSAGTHLLKLINDILDYSRLEAGGLQLSSEPFDLYQLLDKTTSLLRPQAQGKGLSLHLFIAPEIEAKHCGDAHRLQQILVNLIGNAIKFTAQGEVNINIKKHGKDRIYFAISDTGIGIPVEQQHLIFKPFNQLDVGNTREQGGTGLGLSISRHLVEAMGGVLSMESAPGRGSQFDFTLSLPVHHATDMAPPSINMVDSTPLPAATLLIADDSEMNLRVMTAFLQNSPCRLLFAANGVEAISQYREHLPDLVFMDMQMPQLDGGGATREIRAFESENNHHHCPIVALSASAMEEDRQAAIAAGCDDFVAKPISRHQLLTLLKNHL